MSVGVVLWADFSIHCSLVLHGNLFLLLVIFRQDLLVIVSLVSLLEGTLFLEHLLFILVHSWAGVILSMNLFTLLRKPLINLLLQLFLLHCLLIYRHGFQVIIHSFLLSLPRVQYSSLLFPIIIAMMQILFLLRCLFIGTTVSLLGIRSVEFICAVLEFFLALLFGLVLSSASRAVEFILVRVIRLCHISTQVTYLLILRNPLIRATIKLFLIVIVGFSHASLIVILVAIVITTFINWFSSQLSQIFINPSIPCARWSFPMKRCPILLEFPLEINKTL